MEQLEIAGDIEPGSKRGTRQGTKKRSKPPIVLADSDPVAQVVVDINAAQLDHPFDFAVPQEFADVAVPGCRVRVRFAGRLVNGFITNRRSESTHDGRLTPIARVLGPPVLTSEIAQLSRVVADRYAGTANEVLRDAVPVRHVGAEKGFVDSAGQLVSAVRVPNVVTPSSPEIDWSAYSGGAEAIRDLEAGKQVRVGLVANVADSAPSLVGDLVAATTGHAIVVVPDGTDVARFADVFESRLGAAVTRLTGDQKPRDRYRHFLRVRVGEATIVIGTRNSVFAPVEGLRLIVVWDDGDDSLAESRAPGWHAREVAALRSLGCEASLVIAGFSQSVESAKLVEQGWLRGVTPVRGSRHRGPLILTAASARVGDPAAAARIPRFAWEVISQGLERGPVLVQVGRRGYLPSVACDGCRNIATCVSCTGPLSQPQRLDVLACQWCAREYPVHVCPTCGGSTWRAVRVGSTRTAEELHAAFASVPVLVSDSVSGVLTATGDEPAIVVATIGAEPQAASGYSAAVLLDGDAQSANAFLRAGEQLIRRWFNAAALVRTAERGGVIAVTADPAIRAVQALVRGDAAGWAQRELAERRETELPPVTRSAVITGPLAAVQTFADACDRDAHWRILGPTPQSGRNTDGAMARLVILVPTADGPTLAARVKAVMMAGSDGAGPHRVTVRIDPIAAL